MGPLGSHQVPLEGLGHGVEVPLSHLHHHLLIDIVCKTLYSIHCCDDLLFFLLRYIKDHVGGSLPLALHDVPDLLYRVQGAALRGEVLGDEEMLVEMWLEGLGVVHLQVVHDNDRRCPLALLLQPQNEWQEGLHGVGAGERLRVDQPMMHAEGPNHGDRLASLIRQLHSHALFDPEPTRGHPQVKGGLVYVDDICLRLLHQDSCDVLSELLLLVLQLNFSGCLGAIDDLGLSICGPVLQVELSYGPGRELGQL